jgi:hypothetical protein
MSRHNLPALQFYPGDWRKAPDVQSLNYHDRGMWFEMLLLMHESEERGKLMLNGAAMPEDALANVLGVDKQELKTCLSTLLTYGVASLDEETGVIFCRRMVRDESVRQQKIKAGKMGGNPVLLKHAPKQTPTTGVKQKRGSSSSVSTSVITPTGGDQFELIPGTNVSDETVKWSDAVAEKVFDLEFWPIVWAKIGVDAAKRRFVEKVKSRAEADQVIAASKRQGPGILERGRRPGNSVLHPATWLNQGRYKDESPASKPPSALQPKIPVVPKILPDPGPYMAPDAEECFREMRELYDAKFAGRS